MEAFRHQRMPKDRAGVGHPGKTDTLKANLVLQEGRPLPGPESGLLPTTQN